MVREPLNVTQCQVAVQRLRARNPVRRVGASVVESGQPRTYRPRNLEVDITIRLNLRVRVPERPGSAQPDLFSASAPAGQAPKDALREALDALKPDELAPREALEALYRLKNLADE